MSFEELRRREPIFRATLWRKTPAGWKILYHQGTMVESPHT
jgi:hypothetical protein